MFGIPRKVIEHKLDINPSYKLIKQKEKKDTDKRFARPSDKMSINYLEDRFIRSVDYPSWLANLILVEKPNDFWHMCIDYTSVNKTCPRDEYPLPHIC
jgi:hypothetical protein